MWRVREVISYEIAQNGVPAYALAYYLGRTDADINIIRKAVGDYAEYYHNNEIAEEYEEGKFGWGPGRHAFVLHEYQDNDHSRFGTLNVIVRLDCYEFDEEGLPVFDPTIGVSLDKFDMPELAMQYDIDEGQKEVFRAAIEKYEKRFPGRGGLLSI
jgi:hypothetical protein